MKIVGIIHKITKITMHGKILVYVSSNKGYVPTLIKRSLISRNMPVTVEGKFQGKYFVAENVYRNFFNATAYAKYLSTKATGCGIGYKTILKFTTLYQKSLLNITKEEFRTKILNDFANLNVAKVDDFLEAIYRVSTISEIEDFFEEYDIPYETLEKIDEAYGKDAIKKFRENPYRECLLFDIKIRIADFIAKREGMLSLDSKRIDGYIAHVLSNNEKKGHTFIKANELCEKVLGLINRSYPYKNDDICFPIHLANHIATSKRYVILDNGYVFFKKTYAEEKLIANRLLALNNLFKSYITVSEDDIKAVEDKLGITLGEEQRAALKMLETHGVLILTGGPGVGKTATIKAITTLLLMKVPSAVIKYCAPTGRAAKRLSESVENEAVTIHKLVEVQPFEKDNSAKKCAANPIEADFIIVDEMSMVDVSIFSILLDAIKNGTRLLLVGDIYQLPCVGAGNVLHDIINSDLFDVYRLTKNYRQEGDGTIIDNANLVNDGIEPEGNNDDFIIEEFENNAEAKKELERLVEDNYDNNDPFAMQVIEPTNDDVKNTNKYVHNKIINNFDEPFISIGLHDKVMFKLNKYEELDDGTQEIVYANGEMGVITHIDDEEVVINDGFNDKVLSSDVVNDMTLAFSCTIHKSQGSENDLIIIYLPDNASQMMIRALLYTAITRARKKVIIISVSDSLRRCCENEGEKRKTYLKQLLFERAA